MSGLPVSNEVAIKISDAFSLLNGLRSAMLTLCNMYITGVGVFVVAATTLEDKSVVNALTLVTLVFMIGNYVGFFYNFRSQKSIHRFLTSAKTTELPLLELIEDGKPLNFSYFSIIYVAVSLIIILWAIYYSQLPPGAEILGGSAGSS